MLIEQIARLHMLDENPEAALRAIESTSNETPHLLLLRAVSLLKLGRRPEAHLQLVQLARSVTISTEASVLLSLLEWEDGGRDSAITALRSGVRPGSTLEARTLRLLLAFDADHVQAIETAAAELRELALFPHLRDTVELILVSLGLPAATVAANPSSPLATVTRLAVELRAASGLLPSLVFAQRHNFDAASARLLVDSLIHGLGSWPDEELVFGSIVELSNRLDGPLVADIWLQRGLEVLQKSSLLAHMQDQLAAGEEPIVDTRAARRRDVLATIGPPTQLRSEGCAA